MGKIKANVYVTQAMEMTPVEAVMLAIIIFHNVSTVDVTRYLSYSVHFYQNNCIELVQIFSE